VKQFYPANFWDSLPVEEKVGLWLLFSKLPLAVTSENGILGLHGGILIWNRFKRLTRWNGRYLLDRIVWGIL